MRVLDGLGLTLTFVGVVFAYLQVASSRGWWPFAHARAPDSDGSIASSRRAGAVARARLLLRAAGGLAGLVLAYFGLALAAAWWPFEESPDAPRRPASIERSGTSNVTVKGGGCTAIQTAIDELPPAGGSVTIGPGSYLCKAPVVVDRDHVTLRGSGPSTVLKLDAHVNRPVVVLGQTSLTPMTTRRDIRLSDLSIDGNRAQQDYECSNGPCAEGEFLRNNGLSLRRVEDVVVERISVTGARSTGIVTELRSRRVTVRDVTVTGSEFDGLAGYETEDSRFSDLQLRDNAAGLSFDLDFNNNVIRDADIDRSSDVGVFMRDSSDNTFTGVRIRDSGSFGIFLAQVDADTSTPAAANTFSGLVVTRSGRDTERGGHGMRVNDESCVDNVVVASRFIDNRDGAISEARPGLVRESGTIER